MISFDEDGDLILPRRNSKLFDFTIQCCVAFIFCIYDLQDLNPVNALKWACVCKYLVFAWIACITVTELKALTPTLQVENVYICLVSTYAIFRRLRKEPSIRVQIMTVGRHK